jgi:hypothetical protein
MLRRRMRCVCVRVRVCMCVCACVCACVCVRVALKRQYTNAHAVPCTQNKDTQTRTKYTHSRARFEGNMQAGKMKDSVASVDDSVERRRKTSTRGRKALFYPALAWGLPISSSSHLGVLFLPVWDLVIAVGIVYTAIMIPLSLGLQEVFFSDSHDQCYWRGAAPTYVVVWRWLDVLCDFIFMVDLVLSFLTARWVFKGGSKKHWELVDELDQIAIMYLKDTFVTDLLGSLPWQYLDCIPGVDAGGLKAIRHFRLLKLMRLKGLSKLLAQLETMIPNSQIAMLVIKILVTFVLCAHLVGCWFFYVSFGFGTPDSTQGWLQQMFLEGWVVAEGLVSVDGTLAEGKSTFDAWVTCFYWAVTTMSTIGYGDISPQTTPERLLGCVLMVMACSCFAWITGSITSIMTIKPLCEARFDDLLGDIESFMSTVRVPADLRKRILNYYQMRYPIRRIWDEQQIIENIDAPSIREGLVEHLFRDVFERVPLLSLFSTATQREISTKLRNMYRMPGRVITRERTAPDFMYFVRFGQVAIKSRWRPGELVDELSGLREIEQKPRILEMGDIFGELALLGLSPDGLRMRTATAVSVVELCQLAEKDLHQLLIHEKGFFELLQDVCRNHVYGLRMAKELIVQTSATDDLGKCTPVSQKHLAVKNFYEQLTTIRWREMCTVIKQKRESEALRIAMAAFDNERVMELEKMDGRKMMRTSFSLDFKALSFSQLDLSQVGEDQFRRMDSSGMLGMLALIVVRWKGLAGMPLSCVQSETDPFFLDAIKGSPRIAQNLKLPISSPQGVPWEELSSLEFCVMLLPQGTEGMQLDANEALPGQRAKENDSAAAIASKVVRKATTWLTGSLSLRDAVLNRLQKTRCKGTLEVELWSSDGFKAKVEVEVVVKRIPQCEGFTKLRHIVAAKGASPFFIKKLDVLLEKLEAKEEAFINKISSQRLSLMFSLHSSKVPRWTPGNAGGHPLFTLLEATQDTRGEALDSPSPDRNRRAGDITEELRALLQKWKLEEEAACLAAHGVLDLEDLKYMTEDDVVTFGLPLKFRGLVQQVRDG